MPQEEPFRVLVRRDGPSEPTLTIRFNVVEGMGMLSIRTPGRADPGMTVHAEESGIDTEALRAARFVHVVTQNRQSFALSRLTPELCAKLPSEGWVELRSVLEYGFRYLVLPEEMGVSATPAPLTRQVAPRPPPSMPPAAEPRATGPTAERPLPRPVPMEAGLAQAALDSLSREQAIAHLRAQLSVVEQLHQRLQAAEVKLTASRTRERDLLQVLAKWQSQDGA